MKHKVFPVRKHYASMADSFTINIALLRLVLMSSAVCTDYHTSEQGVKCTAKT